ncbi:hypothetical protein QFZ21_004164 [Microbacterium sp. W4I20]|nr:hypothetical protein [Microbacterium sp. W4I20]
MSGTSPHQRKEQNDPTAEDTHLTAPANTMPPELLSYLAGVVTATVGVGVVGLLRRTRRAARARTREQQRQQAARARYDRHEAQKARVWFIPTETPEDDS